MADERIRATSRGPGRDDQATRASHLSEQLRSAALSESRVRLAAALGDPASALALGVSPSAPDPTALGGLVRGLRGHGQEAVLRVGVAAARLALLVWEVDHPQDRRQHDLLDQAARWILDPSPERGEAAYEALRVVNRLGPPAPPPAAPESFVEAVVEEGSVWDVIEELFSLEDEDVTRRTGRVLLTLPWTGRSVHVARAVEAVIVGVHFPYVSELLRQVIGNAVEAAVEATDGKAILGAIQRDVVPWALGLEGGVPGL